MTYYEEYNKKYCKYMDYLEKTINKESVFFQIFSKWLCHNMFIDNLDIFIKKEDWAGKGSIYQ